MDVCLASSLTKSTMSLTKIENLHKRALRFMLHGYSSPYKRTWEKFDKFSMDVKRKYELCIKIQKSLNNLNPTSIKKIFGLWLCPNLREHYKLNLKIPRKKQLALWNKSLKSLGSEIWSYVLPHKIYLTFQCI